VSKCERHVQVQAGWSCLLHGIIQSKSVLEREREWSSLWNRGVVGTCVRDSVTLPDRCVQGTLQWWVQYKLRAKNHLPSYVYFGQILTPNSWIIYTLGFRPNQASEKWELKNTKCSFKLKEGHHVASSLCDVKLHKYWVASRKVMLQVNQIIILVRKQFIRQSSSQIKQTLSYHHFVVNLSAVEQNKRPNKRPRARVVTKQSKQQSSKTSVEEPITTEWDDETTDRVSSKVFQLAVLVYIMCSHVFLMHTSQSRHSSSNVQNLPTLRR